MLRYASLVIVLLWVLADLSFASFLVKRDPIPLDVPISGNLTNTTTNYNSTTWTLWNPIFNQTTWESQPYVYPRFLNKLNISGVEWVYWSSHPRRRDGILASQSRDCKHRKRIERMATLYSSHGICNDCTIL